MKSCRRSRLVVVATRALRLLQGNVFHLMCFIFNDVLLYSCVDHHVEQDEDEEGQDLEQNIGDAGNLIEYINI